MSDEEIKEELGDGDEPRVYELGYLLLPTIDEKKLEEEAGKLKAHIEKNSGTNISDEMPRKIALAYTMRIGTSGDYEKYDHAYFGWIKFEMTPENVAALKAELNGAHELIRFIIFKTVRESTRATLRVAPHIIERAVPASVKRPVKREEEKAAGPVSEKEIDTAIEELVVE